MKHAAQQRSVGFVGIALGALLAAVSSGCDAAEPPLSAGSGGPAALAATTPTVVSASPHPTSMNNAGPDLSRLIIEPDDIKSPTDTFATQSTTLDPGGSDGSAVLYINQDDTKAISITLLLLPDPAAATTALNATVGSINSYVTGGSPRPSSVGAGGTVVSGTSADRSMDLTVLLFTEGRAVVRIEFGSALGDPIPPTFVTDVGAKQVIALRSGLPASASSPSIGGQR